MEQKVARARLPVSALGAGLVVVALLQDATAEAGPRLDPDRVSTRELVAPAARVAAEKLGRPSCREVLSDFRDAAGRHLSEILEAMDRAPGQFFASLTFLDGHAVPRCASGRVAAGANFGSPIIAICKEAFARTQAESPGLAANLLIHEMLHALGLGEDPPTSEEITRRVTIRCGP